MGMTKRELIKELEKELEWYDQLVKVSREMLKDSLEEGLSLHEIAEVIKSLSKFETKKETYEEILDRLGVRT